MEKLKNTQKITLATLTSFARRNKDNLFVKKESSFDGMSDMVEPLKNDWEKTTFDPEKTGYYSTGIQGVYTVGSSRDYFRIYEDSEYYGINVYNCCGNSILAVKKPVEMLNFRDYLK